MTSRGELQVPQWFYEQTDRAKATGIGYSAKPMKVAVPAMLDTSVQGADKKRGEDEDTLKIKRAWELALAPAKSLPGNLIMSYFSGSQLQVVTVSMTAYMFFLGPLQQIMDIQQTFFHLDSPKIKTDIFMTKLVYIGCSLLMVAAGIWKVGQMGLLPTHQSDWLAWEEPLVYYPKLN